MVIRAVPVLQMSSVVVFHVLERVARATSHVLVFRVADVEDVFFFSLCLSRSLRKSSCDEFGAHSPAVSDC